MSEEAGLVTVPARSAVRCDSPEALFRMFYPRLVRALTAVSGDAETAAEAAQEAFVQVWLHWDRVAAYDSPSAWLYRVGVNRLRNHHRARRRLARLVGRVRVDLPPAEAAPVLTARAAALATALRALPEKQRVAVGLHHVAGFTVAEVAELMDVSMGTVSQHLARGCRKVRESLGDHDG